MPGVHTFYDGSKVLEPIALAVGFGVDQVREFPRINAMPRQTWCFHK